MPELFQLPPLASCPIVAIGRRARKAGPSAPACGGFGLDRPPARSRMGHDQESADLWKAVQPGRTPEDNNATMA
jgi:hypothetical protein